MGRRYWQNFRDLRTARGLSQEAVAERLGIKRQGNISTREKHDDGVPEPETIRRHAEALECSAVELLAGVVTEYDKLRTQAVIGAADDGGSTGGPDVAASTAQARLQFEQERNAFIDLVRDGALQLTEDVGQRIAEFVAQIEQHRRAAPREAHAAPTRKSGRRGSR